MQMANAERLKIGSGGLSAEVAPLGAELVRLQDKDGRDLLWDGDPAFWTGHAPLLFPIVGALAGDGYRHAGRHYALPRHGFARRRVFTPVEQGEKTVQLRLEADDETRALYPFEFRLDMRFSIAGDTLTMAASVENCGRETMPVAFGFHPALRWPLPYGAPRAAHHIRFETQEPAPIRRLDRDGLLDPSPRQSPVDGDTLSLDDALFAADAIIFDSLASRRLVYGAEQGPRIEVAFEGMPHLGIWTKPGASYICIEPWQGFADPAGYAGDLRDKPGMVALAAGEARSFAMSLRLVA
jgi:galactose mutarotase-like enzyme